MLEEYKYFILTFFYEQDFGSKIFCFDFRKLLSTYLLFLPILLEIGLQTLIDKNTKVFLVYDCKS